MGPVKFCTDYEVKTIVNEALIDWEERIGTKRHEENGEKFEKLFAAYNRLIGVGLIFIVLKLIDLIAIHSK